MDKTNEYMGYKINGHGIITSPGKFEGEMYYIPYYWEGWLNGFTDYEYQDNDGVLISEFHIDHSDIERFPELKNIAVLELWESNDGFVYSNHVERTMNFNKDLGPEGDYNHE